jgi:hypothetical protein
LREKNVKDIDKIIAQAGRLSIEVARQAAIAILASGQIEILEQFENIFNTDGLLLNKDKQDILKCIKGLKEGYYALLKQIQFIEKVRELLKSNGDYSEESRLFLRANVYFVPIILSTIKELEKAKDYAGTDIMYVLLEIYAENPRLLLEVYHAAPKFAQEVVWKSLTIASYSKNKGLKEIVFKLMDILKNKGDSASSPNILKPSATSPLYSQIAYGKSQKCNAGLFASGQIFLLIWLESDFLFALIEAYFKAVKKILLAKEIKISTEMGRESYGGRKREIADSNRNGVQIYRNETTISNHNVGSFSFNIIYAKISSNFSQKNRYACSTINIGLSLYKAFLTLYLNINNRIEFSFISLIAEFNYFLLTHKMWVNSSGPGTGNKRGINWGYFLFAFLSASSPVKTFPLQITTNWRGYFLTNRPKFVLTKESLSKIFDFIISPHLYLASISSIIDIVGYVNRINSKFLTTKVILVNLSSNPLERVLLLAGEKSSSPMVLGSSSPAQADERAASPLRSAKPSCNAGLKSSPLLKQSASPLDNYLGVDRQVDIEMAQLFNWYALAYVKNLYTVKPTSFVNIDKDTLAEFERLFNFSSLKLDVQRIRFFIKTYIHNLALLKPIGSNNNYFSIEFSVNNLKNFIAKFLLHNQAAFETRHYIIGATNSFFYLFLGEPSLNYPQIRVWSIFKLHTVNYTILPLRSQFENAGAASPVSKQSASPLSGRNEEQSSNLMVYSGDEEEEAHQKLFCKIDRLSNRQPLKDVLGRVTDKYRSSYITLSYNYWIVILQYVIIPLLKLYQHKHFLLEKALGIILKEGHFITASKLEEYFKTIVVEVRLAGNWEDVNILRKHIKEKQKEFMRGQEELRGKLLREITFPEILEELTKTPRGIYTVVKGSDFIAESSSPIKNDYPSNMERALEDIASKYGSTYGVKNLLLIVSKN